MSLRSLSVLLSVLALAASLSGCGDKPEAHAQAPAQEPEVVVETIAPSKVTLTTVLSGRTAPLLVADIRPQVGGIIQKRLFTEGGLVKAGDLLYQIDPAPLQAAFDNARAALAKAEANLAAVKLKAERTASLAQAGAVSAQDNDDIQASRRQGEAEIQACQAALETARINLGYTRVLSPITGRIGKSAVTPGALVTANQATALSTVQQIDPVYVDVTQSSTELLRLKRDMASGRLRKSAAGQAAVRLLYEDGSPYPLEGQLQFSDITVDQSTGVITLRAVFPNPDQDLLPGMYVRAVLEEGVEDRAILAPQRAVTRDPKGEPVALVLAPDGTVEQRKLTVSRTVGDKWLVTSGLSEGDRIIVEGLQKVRPGGKAKAAGTQAGGKE
jgi:membrane fusion protein (multidrug efflux system)